MDAQPSLFDTVTMPASGKHHANAGDTEREGAEFVTPRSGSQRHRMLKALAAAPYGLTDFDLVREVRIARTSVCARRNELMEAGMVADSGRRVRGPFGPRNAIWELTDLGREALITIGDA